MKNQKSNIKNQNCGVPASGHDLLFTFCLLSSVFCVLHLAGCVSDKANSRSVNPAVRSYQRTLAEKGPQQRADTQASGAAEPLGILKPVASDTDVLKPVEIVADPNTGRSRVALTIEEAIARTLANSPEIRVVSFDPSIAEQDITRAASEFDVTAFGRLNFEQEDNPSNSIFQPGQSDDRTLESGVKQKGVTGAEWALSYALTRSWDDLTGRTLPTRYEPILAFQLKQPLLRDAWREVTLAGVDIAKLNYEIAMIGFRQKAEDTAAEVISAYWQLLQARRDAEIQKELLERTVETLTKVQGRRQIDATDVQIKQAEAFAKTREAALVQARKVIIDAQDTLVRLMADSQLNMLDEFEIAPASEASMEARTLERAKLLETAVQTNPAIQQARMAVEIAEINIRVAENRDMPRLDLIASARTQGLARGPENAHDRLGTGDFVSYGVGLSLEYPLGNRQRDAELLKRKLERRKAISAMQNVADQVALLAKERIRRVETSFSQIRIQKEAAEAARVHLRALEDSEAVRQQLTPEFLLVKLQAQEVLAAAERSEIQAIVEFNTALARLAQAMGTVLELHQVKTSLPAGPEENAKIKVQSAK
jgi:outer membrane protein TolC